MPDPAPENPHLEISRLLRRAARLASEHWPEVARSLSPAVTLATGCQAGPGFACVRWFGIPYSFSGAQSKVIAMLWAAWEAGTPDVRQELLLEAAGSDSNHLRDLFREHPAWNVMIVPGASKGTFRLTKPAKAIKSATGA